MIADEVATRTRGHDDCRAVKQLKMSVPLQFRQQ